MREIGYENFETDGLRHTKPAQSLGRIWARGSNGRFPRLLWVGFPDVKPDFAFFFRGSGNDGGSSAIRRGELGNFSPNPACHVPRQRICWLIGTSLHENVFFSASDLPIGHELLAVQAAVNFWQYKQP